MSDIIPANVNAKSVVELDSVFVHFPITTGILGKVSGHVKAVDGVSLQVRRGETCALVGESGCGKTTVAHAILGLVKINKGSITLRVGAWKETGISFEHTTALEKKTLRQHMQVIFQDPFSSLNPRMSIRAILEEPLIIHKYGSKAERMERVLELLDNVGLSRDFLNRYPHEFSGGQRQRIGIARALACNPELMIADEPVSALDVSIRAQIINLLRDLQKRFGQTLLIISHDLGVVRHMADTISVMYQGRIMEHGDCEQIFSDPKHPYTKMLLASIPLVGKGRSKQAKVIINEKTGEDVSSGCLFYLRCPVRKDVCKCQDVCLKDTGNGHYSACLLA